MLSYRSYSDRRGVHITVLGAGRGGTAVASLLAETQRTTLWTRRPEVAEEINREHRNTDYLGSLALDDELTATTSLEESVATADVLVVAVPSNAVRAVLEQAVPHVRPWVPIVIATKGLEGGTNLRLTEVAGEILPNHPTGIWAGPSAACEVLEGRSAGAVIAFAEKRTAESIRDAISTPAFRVQPSEDVIGCEIAGAVTNVIAIAAGMCAGLRTGENVRAAVITDGLAEMARLGLALGGDAPTFVGLAGMGDVIATCASPLSVDQRVGAELADGREVAEIVADLDHVAEGVTTSAAVVGLAAEHGVVMPIAGEVDAVLNRGWTAARAFRGLRPISLVTNGAG